MMRQPELDTSATAELRVTDADLASALHLEPGDEFPAVFATSRMIALMEVAASRLLRPFLEEGELSVGVTVDVVHTAATPKGGMVTATATYTAQEGKLFVFEVSAADDAGEVGRGTHKRAVVATSRLLTGAAKRAPRR
ncbi:MAG TPA: thioesterase [Thermoanaerobaculia bacterium]|nr:thioesterase [Thermoanaerobaculia bacterium]